MQTRILYVWFVYVSCILKGFFIFWMQVPCESVQVDFSNLLNKNAQYALQAFYKGHFTLLSTILFKNNVT